jgi:putative NIF3 family GTP cyclohydrolase 1 type 2
VYIDGEVRRVFVGIDVDLGELLLARSLGADGVIAHHPIGSRARLGLAAVIERCEAQMRAEGIPAEIALKKMLDRQRPVAHALHTANYDRVVDAARRLNIPMRNIHLAADLIGRQYFIDFVGRVVDGGATTVGGLIGQLKTIPEWRPRWCSRSSGWGTPKTRLDDGSSRWRRNQWWRGCLSHVS